jgi:hypothetical protein
MAVACGTNSGAEKAPATTTAAQKVGDDPFVPPPIRVTPDLPELKNDGKTGQTPVSSAASFAWNALIALNWPASSAAATRGVPDTSKAFGQPGTPVWISMRSKVEVYPGNASAAVAPHGVVLDPITHEPKNGPDYGYGDAPQYLYAAGRLKPCAGQPPVNSPALISLDETTEINNNQTFAGAAPATDPQGFNTKPQLIRYAVKMNAKIFSRAVFGQYWYAGNPSRLATAMDNYTRALATGTRDDPKPPFVNYAPEGTASAQEAGLEMKSAWRPLSTTEANSGRFLTATVRYYEQPGGVSCYREAVWGLVGIHVISFSANAPWVIWSTFEQADNILTADGRRTEDVDGKRLIDAGPPTTPTLSSDPNIVNPKVTKAGDYCSAPGARLYFRENPNYGTLPADDNICVNSRWWASEPIFMKANAEAHNAMAKYLGEHGVSSSPLMFYKLVGAQGVPVDYDDRARGTFSTATSYHSANATIETDYSLGNFTGNLVNGVPSNVLLTGSTPAQYINTRLLSFQSNRFDFSRLRMGGCAGCHGFAAQVGQDFSFAIGNNVTEPEATDAFAKPNPRRTYFPTLGRSTDQK